MKEIIIAVLAGLQKEFDKLLLLALVLFIVWVDIWMLSYNHKEPATAMLRILDVSLGALLGLVTGRKRE